MAQSNLELHHHITPPRTYMKVLAALLVLTVITVGASYVDWGGGAMNVIIAMAIATAKATLVALFFMHLRHDSPLNAMIFLSSLAFLGILLSFTLIDSSTRGFITPPNQPTGMYTTPEGGTQSVAPGGDTPTPEQADGVTGTMGPAGAASPQDAGVPMSQQEGVPQQEGQPQEQPQGQPAPAQPQQ